MANVPLKSLKFPGLGDKYLVNGITPDMKAALLQLASKVAYTDEHGQDYYDALYDAFYPRDVEFITAVYTQTGTVYDTDSLDSLRDDLVVTAGYVDGTSETVTTYTLSGTLTSGTSTVTVSYRGKTATFTVTVTHDDSADWDYIWKYTDGLPPASDWAWATDGGSGQVHTIVDDGMKMGSKSGTTASYTMPYSGQSVLAGGYGVAEFEFYLPTASISALTNARIFDVAIGNGTNGLRVKFVHPKDTTNVQRYNILLHNTTAYYTGTQIGTFAFDTPYVVRLEMDSSLLTGKVYINGTLAADNVDLTTIKDAANVLMDTHGTSVDSAAYGIIIQSVKVRYSAPE